MPMKTILFLAATAVALTACDTRITTTPAGEKEKVVEKNTTIVNPPAKEEKKVEHNTTIINPPQPAPAVEEKKTTTTTTSQ